MLFACTPPVPNRNVGGLAVQVWAVSVAWGWALGAGGAVVVALALVAANGLGSDIFTAFLYFGIVAGFGGGFGFAVGIVVGLALALLVVCGHRTLGPRVVAHLMPVVALSITVPLVSLITGSGAWWPALTALDAAFTAIGGLLIARYYLRRVDTSCVH
jgi:hypothetical protein